MYDNFDVMDNKTVDRNRFTHPLRLARCPGGVGGGGSSCSNNEEPTRPGGCWDGEVVCRFFQSTLLTPSKIWPKHLLV